MAAQTTPDNLAVVTYIVGPFLFRCPEAANTQEKNNIVRLQQYFNYNKIVRKPITYEALTFFHPPG